MELLICMVRLIKCPPTYFLQLPDPFDITTGKNIWVHYLENHIWAPEAGTLPVSRPHTATRSQCLAAFLPAFFAPWFSWDIIHVGGPGRSLQWGPGAGSGDLLPWHSAGAPQDLLPCRPREESPRWVKYAGSGPEEGWKSVVVLPDVHISNNFTVSKSSSSKLQIPLFNNLNSARSNSRKCFGQWNVKRFLLVMGSQYHLNSWIIWFFFLLKLVIYKIENPQCFSFQELSGKILLYYR